MSTVISDDLVSDFGYVDRIADQPLIGTPFHIEKKSGLDPIDF